MSDPITALRAGALALLGFASATSGASAEPSVDSVFDLKPVQAIEVTGEGALLVTMQDRVLRLDSFPLEVTGDVTFELANARATMAGADTLVVLGDTKPNAVGGGAFHIYPKLSASLSSKVEPIALSLLGDPFSQVITADQDAVYAVSPTWFAATQISVPKLLKFIEGEDTNFNLGNLFLQCGKVNQLSVFDYNDRQFYVASLAGSKVLEYGQLAIDEKRLDGSQCFDTDDVAQAKGASKFAGARSVIHGLIDPFFEEDPKQILVFDGEAGVVSLYPMLEYRRSLAVLRSEAMEFDLRKVFTASDVPASRSGLMASDDRGEVIWVSFEGSNSVQRLKATEDGFEFLGTLRFREPVRALDVAANGEFAAVVTGPDADAKSDTQAAHEVTVLRDPKALAAKAALPRERFSVRKLQQMLDEAGVDLKVDGILGVQTREALDAQSGQIIQQTGSSNAISPSVSLSPSAPQSAPVDLKTPAEGILPLRSGKDY